MQSDKPSLPLAQPGHYSFRAQTVNQGPSNAVPSTSERTGRKSYKLSHNRDRNGEKKEQVWPPELEDALLEGLRIYRPTSKSGRPLRRFTKRNVSIATHILRRTGISRTAKQVGSRLQQITESSKDPEIIHLITCRDTQPTSDGPPEHPPPPYAASSSSTTVSPEGSFSSGSPRLTNSNTPSTSVGAASPIASLDTFEECTSLHAGLVTLSEEDRVSYLGLDADLTPQGANIILTVNQTEGSVERESTSLYERVLSDMPCSTLFDFTPTLSIVSWRLSPDILYSCTFTVAVGNSSLVHSEECRLSVSRPNHPGERFTYVTEFLPTFWSTLPPRSDLDSYSITVDIYEARGTQSVGPVHRLALAIGRGASAPVSYSYAGSSRLPSSSDFDFNLPLNTLADSSGSTTIPDLAFNHMPTGYEQIPNGIDNSLSTTPWTDGAYYLPNGSLADARFLSNQDSPCPDYLPGYGFQRSLM